jgi:RNA polymerase sigma factor (sigma-70 family)
MTAAAQRTLLQHFHRLATTRDAEVKSDAELLAAFAQRRDEAVFAVLLRRHASMVWGVCRRVLQHHQDAEDAFQATFLVLARNAGAVRNGQALAAWLHRAAYRIALMIRRTAARRRHREAGATVMAQQDPCTELAWREVQALLEDEIQRLPEKYRTAFVLCCLESRGRADAARLLGVREGTLSSRLDQARKRLQRRLTRRGITLSAVLAAAALAEPVSLTPLCAATAKAAVNIATASVAGLAADRITRLVAHGSRVLFAAKPSVISLILAATVAMLGVGLIACQPRADVNSPDAVPAQAPVALQPDDRPAQRLDVNGDPLPDEALARLGTLRFRTGGFVSSLAFAPDARTIVAHGTHGVACVFDAATGRALRRFQPGATQHRCAVSSDGRWLVVPAGKSPLRIDHEVTLELWEIATGTRARSFGKGPYADACFAADGKTLAGLRYDEVVEIWDPHAGRMLRQWKAGGGPGYDLDFAGQFTTEGAMLLTRHRKQTIRCWDVASGSQLRQVSDLFPSDLFAVSPAGILAVDGRDRIPPGQKAEPTRELQVRLVDVTTGKDLGRLTAPLALTPNGRPNWFIGGRFSPDGTQLATAASDGQVRLWDVAARKQVRAWSYMSNFPGAMSFSQDGRRLALADAGTTVRVLEVAGGTETQTPPGPRGGHRHVVFTPDGSAAISLGRAEPASFVWDAATGRLRQHREWSGEQMALPALNATGTAVYSWGSDRSLRVWDLASGKELRSWRDEFSPYFMHIVPSPDDRSLALIYQNPTIVLADATTGKELRRLEGHAPWPFGAAFAPDGRTLITWGADARVCVWDVATGQRLREISYVEIPDPKRPVPPAIRVGAMFVAAVSPDASLIALGSSNGRVVIHELATGRELRRIGGLPGGVPAMAFSPNGRMLAWSGADDPTVRLLEVATGKERHRLTGHLGQVVSLAFAADGRRLVSASLDTTSLIWDLGPTSIGTSEADRTALWNDLAGHDAARAHRAMRLLAASPGFFDGRLKPAQAVDAAHVARLITDLGSDDFAVRDKANRELERLGDAALPACRKAIAREPALELRRRLESLIEKQVRATWQPDPERLRTLRSLEALELAGTSEALRLLDRVAASAAGTWLSDQAAAALRRLRP